VPQITVPANNLVLYLPAIQEKQFDYSWLQIFMDSLSRAFIKGCMVGFTDTKNQENSIGI
jgi:hypothetical protein